MHLCVKKQSGGDPSTLLLIQNRLRIPLKFHRRLRIGETLLLQGEVKETFVRRDRPYVVSDFEARDETGALVASGRVTSIWGSAE